MSHDATPTVSLRVTRTPPYEYRVSRVTCVCLAARVTRLPVGVRITRTLGSDVNMLHASACVTRSLSVPLEDAHMRVCVTRSAVHTRVLIHVTTRVPGEVRQTLCSVTQCQRA